MPSMMLKTLIAGLAGSAMALPQVAPTTVYPVTNSTPPAAPSKTAPLSVDENKKLFGNLSALSTTADRFRFLAEDKMKVSERLVFNFSDTPAKGAKGGAIAAANVGNFPALLDSGLSVAVGFIGPCGMNTPHTHPRASEFLTVVEGRLQNGFILENNFNTETVTMLEKFQGTLFPMGSIHYQFNPDCTNVTFVAALSDEDAGTSQIAQNFFGLNPDVVNATLGFPQQLQGVDIDKFRKNIPTNVALGIDKCLKYCNITPNKYD